MVELSIGDATSGLVRLPVAECDKPLLVTNKKAHVTCERYARDLKLVLETNRNRGHSIAW
jgi:hypothetical protein